MSSRINAIKTAVQSVRGVGCKRGYPYFATGLYRIAFTQSGRMVWRLAASKGWHRSTRLETCGTFAGAVELEGVRHNRPVTAAQLAALRSAA